MVAIAGGAASVALNIVTESMDAAVAIYNALPWWLRRQLWKEHGGYMSPWDKAMAVYENFAQLNLADALRNLAMEQLEDKAYGKLGRVAADANRRRGSPGGLNLGPALEGGGGYGPNF